MEIKALILLSGAVPPDDLSGFDPIICADSGYQSLDGTGMVPEILIGDMDSVGEEYLERAMESGVTIISHDRDKDWTDGELAVSKAIDMGARELVICGGLNGRLDHILSSFHMLNLIPPSVKGELRMGSGRVLLIRAGESINLDRGSELVSVLPSSETCVITEKGFRWNLEGYRIEKGSTRGIHNEIVENKAFIGIEEGCAYIVITPQY